MNYKLLIVDDEEILTELISDHFSCLGYIAYVAGNSEEAIEKLKFQPDLILLDINMSGMNGLELCKKIRNHISCPIIFLTARITEQDKINGLRMGGDDYITKPFSMEELTARVEAHLRRDERSRNVSRIIASNELFVDCSQRVVFYKEKEIVFPKKEFDIIEFLLQNANQVFDKEHIYDEVWGMESDGCADVVKEHIRRIRTKLHNITGHEYIETVWGIGYKWIK